MQQEPRSHWQTVYETKAPADVSWFQPIPERSLELIKATGVPLTAPILDVGGGASTLVDCLARAGYRDLTVLDIAPAALDVAKSRLGSAAASVEWLVADITDFRPTRRYALWHDRAMLHFLVDADTRSRYLSALHATIDTGGHAVIATFGPQGPIRCSGLGVRRYSTDEISLLLGPAFRLQKSVAEEHLTPGGQHQQFLYGWWQLQR